MGHTEAKIPGLRLGLHVAAGAQAPGTLAFAFPGTSAGNSTGSGAHRTQTRPLYRMLVLQTVAKLNLP